MKRLRPYIIPVAVAFALGVLVRDVAQDWRKPKPGHAKLSAQEEARRAVLCPLEWHAEVWQRYDDRNPKGEITKRTWIGRCA